MRELLRYAITCLSFSLAAQAQEPDAIFARYDRDKDGKVTAAELPNKAAFARYDLDKDGAITVAEYAKGSSSAATPSPSSAQPAEAKSSGASAMADLLIKAADKDGDGRITKAEAGDAAWFARVDQDKDGVIGPE